MSSGEFKALPRLFELILETVCKIKIFILTSEKIDSKKTKQFPPRIPWLMSIELKILLFYIMKFWDNLFEHICGAFKNLKNRIYTRK